MIAQHLPWHRTLHLSNSCISLVFLRHALDIRLNPLLEPERIASGILAYRKQQRSKYIAGLIMQDGRKHMRAMTNELDAGLDIFRQWWTYEPYEPRTPGRQHRQPPDVRHSELGYAVMRSYPIGLKRYWRIRELASGSSIRAAYLDTLIQEARLMLAAKLEDTDSD